MDIKQAEEIIQTLREANYKLELELAATKPLYSRRKLQAEHDSMREALEFYANCVRSALHEDSGNRAREALAKLK